MQQVDVQVVYDLFTVAVILWGGIFMFLLWLYFKMERIDKALKTLDISDGEDM